MNSILEVLASKEDFRIFIDENMRLSTYVPLWKSEIPDSEIEFSASKQFSTYTAEYGRAVMASMIEKNALKPTKTMPTLGQITGSIGRMGNIWQLDDDRLQRLYEMEARFKDKSANYSAEKRSAEWLKMVTFLFNPYEIAAISPHKRLDFLYYEGVSNGTLTVTLANNPDGIQFDPIDLSIKKYGVAVVWNQANAATMDALGDLRKAVNSAQANGRKVLFMRMTPITFAKLAQSAQFNGSVKLNLGTLIVDPVGQLGVDKVNQYLAGIDLPPIQLETKMIAIDDENDVNAFQDDRVVLQLSPVIAKMIVSEPLEAVDPHPNKVYSTYEDNLISSYRTTKGRFVENEMWATPIFTGAKNFQIIKVDTLFANI